MNHLITEENLYKKYQAAKSWTEKWSDHFDEFTRIARNEPPEGIPEQYADVSDGTTAALIRKTPKRIIQQLPTGTITSENDSGEFAWLPIVAEFILLNKIIPYAKGDYDLIQKWWTAVENGNIVGGQAVYTPFVRRDGEFTTDAQLIYWGDIFFQPGKKSFYSCDYIFIRSWWQPETIDALIESDKQLAKETKANGEKYERSWDIQALKEIRNKKVTKDEQGKTASETANSVDTEAIEIVTCFQKGVGATFYVFNPSGSAGKILRRKKNKDPRGMIPVDYFYADVDGSNPFGRSNVELLGPLQNMIDGEMRLYKHNRALALAPPLMVYGNIDTTQAIYEPDSLIEMGDDPKNRIEPFTVDTTAIRDYSNIYSLNKSQLLNLYNTGGDTSIESEVGNPGFGKTPFALKQQKEIMSADDNYQRKNFESFFENWCETAINVYFAEREGVEELQLDKQTAEKLRGLVKEGKLDEGFVRDDNTIMIDYSSATPALHFRVDASTSKMNSQSEQLEALQLLLEMASNPSLAQLIPAKSLAVVWNKIVANSGVEDPDKLSINTDELEQQSEMDTMTETDDEAVIQALREQGVPDDMIVQALEAEKNGVPAEQILNSIERLMSNGA